MLYTKLNTLLLFKTMRLFFNMDEILNDAMDFINKTMSERLFISNVLRYSVCLWNKSPNLKTLINVWLTHQREKCRHRSGGSRSAFKWEAFDVWHTGWRREEQAASIFGCEGRNSHCLVLIIMRINNQSQNKYDDIQWWKKV